MSMDVDKFMLCLFYCGEKKMDVVELGISIIISYIGSNIIPRTNSTENINAQVYMY